MRALLKRLPIYGITTLVLVIAIAAAITSMVPFLFLAMARLP